MTKINNTGAGGKPAGKTTMNLSKSDLNQMGFLLSYNEDRSYWCSVGAETAVPAASY